MHTGKQRTYTNLAAWRNATGLSQMEASRVLGISQTSYSRLERRVVAARGKRARSIWRQTGVPVEVLVGAV
jgi:transcriptional regulator with XRE-family HTH domain